MISIKRKNMNKDSQDFLHNHPTLESQLGLTDEHVIVDRAEWERMRKRLLDAELKNTQESGCCLSLMTISGFHFWSAEMLQRWHCPNCDGEHALRQKAVAEE
jgi:hypothetical protein